MDNSDTNLQQNESELQNAEIQNATKMQETVALLKEGDQNIVLSEEHKDIVLVLGNTGSGKSTLTQLIAGDNDNLVSKEGKLKGDFLIEDTNDRISNNNNTLNSKTIFPDLVIDTKTSIGYYDCPGFSDTRSSTIDIAASYFIRKVIDHAKSVKLLFVVNFSAVDRGGSRDDFQDLLKHATTLVKDIDKFKDSIALVATKAKNRIKNKKRVPDSELIRGIGLFLQDAIKSFTLKMKTDKDNTFNLNAIKICNILLKKTDENYDRIGLFPRPNMVGKVSTIRILQNARENIKHIIDKELQFTEKVDDDFGYTVAASTKNDIADVIDGINNQITNEMISLNEQLMRDFVNIEIKYKDIYEIQNKFLQGYSNSLNLKQLKDTEDPKTFLTKLSDAFEPLDISLDKRNVVMILQLQNYFEFLEMISEKKLPYTVHIWWEKISALPDELYKLNNCYNLLISLYEKLGKYEYQEKKENFNIMELKVKVSKLKEKTAENLLTSLNLINANTLNNLDGYGKIKSYVFNKEKLNFFYNILEITLHRKIQTKLEKEQKLKVHGDFIKLSNVMSHENFSSNLTAIEIYATNTVFFDANFTNSNQMKLEIFSPKWEIIENSTIDLTGKAAKEYEKTASTGASVGLAGGKGLPGKSGVSGGVFFGLSNNILNGNNLRIIVNGGKGGTGQTGGQGAKGKKGNGASCKIEDNGWHHIIGLVCDGVEFDNYEYVSEKSLGEDDRNVFYHICGLGGKNGSMGGEGGVGGHPGKAGEIKILNLSNISTAVKQQIQDGAKGNDGNGGIGGVGGDTGDYCKGTLHKFIPFILMIRKTQEQWTEITCGHSIKPIVKCKEIESFTGEVGKSGINDREQEKPNPALKVENPWKSINNYKSFLRESMKSNSIHKNDLINFYNLLNNNNKIKSNYKTLGFVDELQSLEKHYLKLKDDVNFLPFYENLLNRILKYAQQRTDLANSQEEKKVLVYLYTATLTKICSINNDFEKNIIINIRKYLNIIESKIKVYGNEAALEVIQDHQKTYKDDVDSKISEATNFVTNEIKPAVTQALYAIDAQIVYLINETVDKREEVEKQKRKAERLKKDLERGLKLKSIFGGIKLSLSVLNFLGPIGSMVNSGIGVGLDLGENMSINPPKDGGTLLTIPDGVKSALDFLGERFKEAKDDFDEQIKEVSKLIDLPDKPLPDLTKDIKKIQDQIKTTENVDDISKLRKDLNDKLKGKKKLLELEKNDLNESKIEPKLKVLKNVQDVVKVMNNGIEFYNKLMNDKDKIAKAAQAIDDAEKSINELKEYEKTINNVMIPLTKTVAKNIADVEAKLEKQTHVALDMTKWRIQSSLRDVKLQLQKMTKGFKVQEDVTRCIDKLEEGMTVMIQLFDRIESYKDQKKLANYIADIESDASRDIVVKNEEFKVALSKLNLAIQANIILLKYESAFNGLKQYLFPFAVTYMEELSLPKDLALNSNDDLKTLVNEAKDRVTKMLDKLNDADATIKPEHDKFLQRSKFNRFKTPINSFYVWKNEENAIAIKNFLGGKPIYLKADVDKTRRNAVKFNVLNLYLNTHDAKKQKKLDDLLQTFVVRLTHLGNSYYRCDDKVYLIQTNNQTVIEYSFANDTNGVPNTKNVVYEKLSESDYMLSPYALWKFQLLNEDRKKFNGLESEYNKVIDLELEGKGQYIRSNANICKTDLEKYYELDYTISETDEMENLLQENDADSILNDYFIYFTPNRINDTNVDDEESVISKTDEATDDENVDTLARKIRSTNFSGSIVIDWIGNRFSNMINWFSPNNNTIREYPVLESISSANDSASADSMSFNSTNLNSTLVLADLVMRKYTGIKPKSYKSNNKVESLNNLSVSLNIIENFEKMIEEIIEVKNIPNENLAIDYSKLVGKIQKKITKNEIVDIYNILYKVLKNYQLIELNSDLDSKLWNVIEKSFVYEENYESKFSSNEIENKSDISAFAYPSVIQLKNENNLLTTLN